MQEKKSRQVTAQNFSGLHSAFLIKNLINQLTHISLLALASFSTPPSVMRRKDKLSEKCYGVCSEKEVVITFFLKLCKVTITSNTSRKEQKKTGSPFLFARYKAVAWNHFAFDRNITNAAQRRGNPLLPEIFLPMKYSIVLFLSPHNSITVKHLKVAENEMK